MDQQFKNVLNYYEEIVAEGDQGETHDAIHRDLKNNPQYIEQLKAVFLQETDADRKEVLCDILCEYDLAEVAQYMRAHGIE